MRQRRHYFTHTVCLHKKQQPRQSKVQWLEFIIEFSRGTAFEINIQKNQLHFYTPETSSEKL